MHAQVRIALALALLLACAPRPAASSVPAGATREGSPAAETEEPAAASERPPAPAAEESATASASELVAVETSVKPGINDVWRSGRTASLVKRLESESREVWVQRERIVEVVGARPGMVIADIGAGSGFFTLMLARAVSPGGEVYALDINDALLARIARRARTEGLRNVHTVVTPERAIPLAPESVDLVFLCDAYHHFEYPRAMMRSIRAALRPGGELVLVELERIPGVTSPAMLRHVRAPREVFQREIESDGFVLVRAHEVPALKEHYVLRFRKL
ncbi:MAG TPA: class I SAM-dependent methyltransferase [Nannocystis sp.]